MVDALPAASGPEAVWVPFAREKPERGQVIEYRLGDLFRAPDGVEVRRGVWDAWRSVVCRADKANERHYPYQLADWRPSPPGPFVQAPDGARLDLGTCLGRSLALCWIAERLSPSASLGVCLDIASDPVRTERIRHVCLYGDEEVYIYPVTDRDLCHGDPDEEPAPIVPGLAGIDFRLSPPLLHPLVVHALWIDLMGVTHG